MIKTPIAVLGIDLGKNTCSLAGLDATGAVVLRKKMSRESVVIFVAALPTCVIAMEACCGAHYLGRMLSEFAARSLKVGWRSPINARWRPIRRHVGSAGA